MDEGETVVDAPQLDEAAVEDGGVDEDSEQRPEAGYGKDGVAQAGGQQRVDAGIALARDRGVGFLAEPEALRVEGAEREGQEHDGEHGGLRRENGDRFRREVLSRGGAVDAMEAYRAFRGRDPEIAPLLARRGLAG